jgi:hypothetical protein
MVDNRQINAELDRAAGSFNSTWDLTFTAPRR